MPSPPKQETVESAYRRGYVEGLRAGLARRSVGVSCLTCGGRGSIPGFWFGSLKECPACKGSGRRG